MSKLKYQIIRRYTIQDRDQPKLKALRVMSLIMDMMIKREIIKLS